MVKKKIIRKKGNITKALDKLNKNDLMSLVFFALFKLREEPKYAPISELAYVLDSTNLLRFLEYFEGITIKVPTLDEMKIVLNALLLYNYVKLENIDIKDAITMLDKNKYKTNEIVTCYYELCDILNKYNFKRGD